jgi:hypothetical protein
MYSFLRSPAPRRDALHKLFAVVFTLGVSALAGFGVFAIGSAMSGSTAVGIALASLASLSLFSPMLSLLSVPDEGIRMAGEEAPPLRGVFSSLF